MKQDQSCYSNQEATAGMQSRDGGDTNKKQSGNGGHLEWEVSQRFIITGFVLF